jgi:signal transduction histidine kinase
MYLFILGALSTQLCYIMIQWWRLRSKEYLLYAAYILTFILYAVILFQEDILKIPENSTTFLVIDSFKRPFAFLLYFEYFLFGQYFIDLKNRFPTYYRILQPLKKIILGFIAIMIIFRFANIQYSTLGNACYYLFSIFLFIFFTVFIIKLWKSDDQLIRYLLRASLSVTVGALLSNLLIVAHMLGIISESLAELYFIPTCIGAGFEIYFLNTGIVYKSSLFEKKLIATQQELIGKLKENEILLTTQQNIRNKIAQDLHDEVGSTLSSIHIYSSVASRTLEKDVEKAKAALSQIKENTRQVMENVSDIVWAMNKEQIGGTSLEVKLKNYGYELLNPLNINCFYSIDKDADKKIINMEARKNILLIAKEAMNNIAKYSQATEASVKLEFHNGSLQMEIVDNGKGFDEANLHRGNGIYNMRQRAETLGGSFHFRSENNRGTVVQCNIPVTNTSY